MKVSVCMISYNQEKFICEAIEGVINQKTSFDYELVISDDCSTDKTYAIIQEYQAKYPELIRVIHRTNNLGMMPNFISTLQSCIGQYVAICEGDDYWIDNLKLQKQVDFLDNNLDYAICFTRVYELIGGNKQLVSNNPWEEEKTFSIIDLAKGNFISALSVMFRNNLINNYPSWFYKSSVGDYVIHMLNARRGLIKYLPEPMGVYRMYTGLWSTKTLEVQMSKFIDVLECLLQEDFDFEVLVTLKNQRYDLMTGFCSILLSRNDFSFINKFSNDISELSPFAKNMITKIYPDKIDNMQSGKIFKIHQYLSKIKRRLLSK